MIILAFRITLFLIMVGFALWVAWRIIRTIPEVRVLLRLDEIEGSEKLARKVSNVNEYKHASNKEKIKNFLNGKGEK